MHIYIYIYIYIYIAWLSTFGMNSSIKKINRQKKEHQHVIYICIFLSQFLVYFHNEQKFWHEKIQLQQRAENFQILGAKEF